MTYQKVNYDNPMQPVINYPPIMFGKVKRSFQSRWYEQFPWLEYSIRLNAAFCFACRFFITSNPDPTFSSLGFKDWKHATGHKGILSKHSTGKTHTQAMATWKEYETRSKTGDSIGCQLDRMGSKVINENRKYVMCVMEAILYCSQQGIALRGHDESHDSLNPGNFRSLMTLLSLHSPEVSRRLQECRSSATWLAPSFQNEIIQFLASKVLSLIKQELHEAKYFTLLADECKDVSKREQLSIAFRYVYKSKTFERFAGYSLASELNARALTNYITSKMTKLELNSDNLVSQCFDGASVMSGCNAGVQKLVKENSPQAIYVHCCAHRLNLVLVDVAKRVRAASDFFSHLQALYVFLSASKCHEHFLSNQNSLGGREIRLKKLSDTRWSCRIDSITAILATFSAVLKTLQDTIDGTNHDRAIEASGILNGVQSFNFIVALVVYKKIFSLSAKLSDVLQSRSLDLATASDLIHSTIDTFKELRPDGVIMARN